TQGRVVLDQAPAPGKLLIELIVWDSGKKIFNFYEMIGTAQSAQWFYRGDSADILEDNQFLYRTPPVGQPQFGNRLRCSACHGSGGPIMKELAPPHNDWWTVARPLPLSPNAPSSEVAGMMEAAMDAGQFSKQVQAGISKLEESAAYRKLKNQRSLQESLRPVFCESEINLESDQIELAASAEPVVSIPAGFFINPNLGPASPAFSPTISKFGYKSLLSQFKTRFPETSLPDADHAWLTPVKGHSDHLAIQSLVADGVVKQDWTRTVLAVDLENPVFSETRCSLLKHVPEKFSADWRSRFLKSIQVDPAPAALKLVHYLEHPAAVESDVKAHLAKSGKPGSSEFQKLLDLRRATFTSEISQNPRGQILEPGFRVIFPDFHAR
ncbi:MAG: hypothetical protein AAB425_15210, partial [Bdellovibrionota bacterium]